MDNLSFLKRVIYSITGKNYKELTESKSIFAIIYLAIFELTFTLIISTMIAIKMQFFSIFEVYNFVYNFLVDFLYNSVSLTFDLILVISVILYIFYRFILKKKIKYSKMFNLGAYSSTLGMIIKYVVFILNYQVNMNIEWFKYVYIAIVIFYSLINIKNILKE